MGSDTHVHANGHPDELRFARHVNAREACRNFGALLDDVQYERDSFVITRRGMPIATIAPIAPGARPAVPPRRPLGRLAPFTPQPPHSAVLQPSEDEVNGTIDGEPLRDLDLFVLRAIADVTPRSLNPNELCRSGDYSVATLMVTFGRLFRSRFIENGSLGAYKMTESGLRALPLYASRTSPPRAT